MRRSIVAAFAVALIFLGILAVPASAYEFGGDALYARFGPSATAGQGLVVIDRTDGSHPQMHGTFVGLTPHVAQTIVFRTIGCGGTPSSSNRILRINGTSDATGELSYSGAVAASPDYQTVMSAWSAAGSAATCIPVVQVTRVIAGLPTDWGYLGVVKTGPGTLAFLAEKRSADHLRLTIVVNGLGGTGFVQLTWSNVACGHPVTASSIVYSDTFPAALKTGTVSVPFSELRNVMSLRIRNTGTGFTKCAPAVIMANTEG